MPDRRLVLASSNAGKAREFAALMAGSGWTLVLPRDAGLGRMEVPEGARSYLENATLKAVAYATASGLPALADDSGLEVDGLVGAPGVRSARYAGDDATDADNVARLLDELTGRAEEDPGRRARFRCVVVLAGATGELVAEGVVEGRIATEARGVNGFGYDPVFVPDDGDGRTFAEMGAEEKHAISHRGRALAALVAAVGDA